MKKSIVFLFFILVLFTGFISKIYAQDPSESGSPLTDDELSQIQDATNQIPLTDTGELDKDKVIGFKSKAVSRIIGILLVIVSIVLGFTVKMATWIDNLLSKWWVKAILIILIIVLS